MPGCKRVERHRNTSPDVRPEPLLSLFERAELEVLQLVVTQLELSRDVTAAAAMLGPGAGHTSAVWAWRSPQWQRADQTGYRRAGI
jgi:hypothetical protein